jgi:hypothetical protein
MDINARQGDRLRRIARESADVAACLKLSANHGFGKLCCTANCAWRQK